MIDTGVIAHLIGFRVLFDQIVRFFGENRIRIAGGAHRITCYVGTVLL